MPRRSKTTVAIRFWSHVVRCTHEEQCPYCCWEWQGSHLPSGHGLFGVKVDGTWTHIIASRQAWILINERPMPQALYSCHHCDNPPCCNPWHLFVGTQRDNMQDARRKGRVQRCAGESSSVARLNNAAIALIWSMHKEGIGAVATAKHLQVSTGAVQAVLEYRTWSQISKLYSDGPSRRGRLRGDHHSQARLTSTAIPQIWEWHRQGRSITAIADALHVARTTISSVLRYETWGHISRPLNEEPVTSVQYANPNLDLFQKEPH
jgi:hypothetical protein